MQEDIACFQGCCWRRWGSGEGTSKSKRTHHKRNKSFWNDGRKADNQIKM